MVISCSAPGCQSKKDNNNSKGSVQFHRFPLRKPDILAKWIKAMRCNHFKPTVTSYLCSAHFTNSDYDVKSNNGGKHLKPNAVPSYFEKRRPGRKKKVVNVEAPKDAKNNAEESPKNKEDEEEESMEEEYLQLESEDKVESNLAEIIGNQEKGSLQVLIVGEDGKITITNSDYIFKKEHLSDDEFKLESDTLSQNEKDTDDENLNQFKNGMEDKGNHFESSSELAVFNYRDLKYREKIERLQRNLTLVKKKLKVLQMKYGRVNKQKNELKFLLKLLVLKRGRGEKNLDQLLEEYEKQELEKKNVKVKEETYAETE